ncbi:hypothetical protein SADUNF_Sadunf18G0113200 [Salix dunnii]|uniref:Uncharacterized protein n=1 Tax=Salix dunnii TaxID=1413687 RepID=A0A835MGR1_9ROSI|nr:hypothetical protein SADUNF_Sadunf18G0113200 [Salix dunnii]
MVEANFSCKEGYRRLVEACIFISSEPSSCSLTSPKYNTRRFSHEGLEPAGLADEKYVGEGRSIIEQGTEDTDVDIEEAISLQVESYEILISSCAKPARNVSESCEEPTGEKRFLSSSASKLITEESSNEMMLFGSSCIISGSEKGNSIISATNEPNDSQNEIVNCVSPSSLSIVPSEVSLALKSPTPSVSPRINSRKSLQSSSMLTASQKDSKDERSNPILPVDMGEREVLLEEIQDLRSQFDMEEESSKIDDILADGCNNGDSRSTDKSAWFMVSTKLLARSSPPDLKTRVMSSALYPSQTTGLPQSFRLYWYVCLRISGGSSSGVRQFLEGFLCNRSLVGGKYHVLVGAEALLMSRKH